MGIAVLFVGLIFSTLFSCFNLKEKKVVIADNNLFLTAQEIQSRKNESYLLTGSTLFALSPTSIKKAQVLGSSKGSERDNIISYNVNPGDSLTSIAKKYNISVDTIKWANTLNSNSDLTAGDELLILPTTGVLYYVKKYDTPSEIAQTHNADLEKIISYNDIENVSQIQPGDQLIIPNGEKPANIIPQTSPSSRYTGFSSVTYGTVTQGMHTGHNAVDIANNCGTPIYSGGSGVVTRTGYDPYRAGNYVWVDHGSFKALYAHLQGIYVSAGQRVDSGQQIATMGNTGYTLGPTGCHIHFEVRGGVNPFSNMQRGQTMR